MRLTILSVVTATLLNFTAIEVTAQSNTQSVSPAAGQQTLPAEQLDALVAPIALYDDQLLAQVLMASTYPLEVVEANRWAKENKSLKGETLKTAVAKQIWDDSVKGLVVVPPVLDMMSTKLDWTQKLGDAVLAQQADVMDSIQRLRSKAQAQGKLTSTNQHTVTVTQEQSKQVIAVAPAVPDTLYVPYYDPAVVYGAWPNPAYPPFYWPPPAYIAGAAIATGIAWGTAWAVGHAIFNGGFNWGGNNIVINRNITINNIGNRIANNTNFQNWQHNPEHRHGLRYNNDAIRQKFANRTPGSPNQRLDFRGREGQQILQPNENRPDIGNRSRGQPPDLANRATGNRGGQVSRPRRDTGFSNIQPRNLTNAQANRGRQSLASRGGAHAFASAPRTGGGARFAGRGGGRRSDITLKHDIVLLGYLANGIGYYRFSYNGSERAYVGVMAQEVEEVMPDAVVRDRDGSMRVFYDKLGIKFQTYKHWIASGTRVPVAVPGSR